MSEDAPEFAEDDGEGGPRKSFWAHLEDLRGALVKSAVVVVLALGICLLLDAQLVRILEYPLRRMTAFEVARPTVTLELGSSLLGPTPVTREEFPALPPGPAPQAVYKVSSAVIAGQTVLTLKPDLHPPSGGPLSIRLHNLSPAEAFLVAFHVALYAALAVSSPFWIYFLGGFILPAFNFRERQLVFRWIGWGVALFATGVLSTYFFLLPVALRASVKYSQLLGFSAADWQAGEYIDFVCKFLFGMGVGFQFPLVVLFLVKLGILTHRQLAHFRRHVIVLSLILGALLTTPEPITQIAMAVPLYLLYETCIWIAWYWDRQKRRSGEIPPG
jgi:sec-independent protein translocase protein TatC